MLTPRRSRTTKRVLAADRIDFARQPLGAAEKQRTLQFEHGDALARRGQHGLLRWRVDATRRLGRGRVARAHQRAVHAAHEQPQRHCDTHSHADREAAPHRDGADQGDDGQRLPDVGRALAAAPLADELSRPAVDQPERHRQHDAGQHGGRQQREQRPEQPVHEAEGQCADEGRAPTAAAGAQGGQRTRPQDHHRQAGEQADDDVRQPQHHQLAAGVLVRVELLVDRQRTERRFERTDQRQHRGPSQHRQRMAQHERGRCAIGQTQRQVGQRHDRGQRADGGAQRQRRPQPMQRRVQRQPEGQADAAATALAASAKR